VPFTEVLSGLLLVGLGVYLIVLAARQLRRASRDVHHDHPHEHDHAHDHPHAPGPKPLAHSHGGRSHTHAPLPTGGLGWKSLVGMGVAGGLVPSPSALLVLLGATALGRAWFGVVLVVVYGMGMAITLTAAGLLLLRAQALMDRRGWGLRRGRNVARLLPLATAGVVVLIGAGLLMRGVMTGSELV
jgi:ABC-type nickel/cobalt efflux system permease component RcnA